MKNISNKCCKEIGDIHFVFNNNFPKSCSLWDNVAKYCRAGQDIYDHGACALHAGYLRLETHTQVV